MAPRSARFRRAIPFPPRHLLATLASGAALDGVTGLVILSAGNSYLLESLGAHAALPAIALTLQGLVKIGVSPSAGSIADRRRLAVVLPAVPILSAIGLVTMLSTGGIPGYLAGLVALTAGTSIAWVLLRHCVGDLTDEAGRGRATTWLSLASGGGVAAGFGAGTLLAGLDPRAAFVIALPVVGLGAFGLDRVRRAALLTGTPARSASVPPSSRGPSWRLGILTAGQFALSAGLLVSFWPFVLRDLDVQISRLPLLLAPAGVITLVALALIAGRSQPRRRQAELALLHGLVAGGFALSAVSHSAWLFALALCSAVPALVAAMPVVTALVIDFSRGRRGPAAVLGWIGSAEATGTLAGAGGTGLVIASHGARGALGVLSLLALALAVSGGVSFVSGRQRLVGQPT